MESLFLPVDQNQRYRRRSNSSGNYGIQGAPLTPYSCLRSQWMKGQCEGKPEDFFLVTCWNNKWRLFKINPLNSWGVRADRNLGRKNPSPLHHASSTSISFAVVHWSGTSGVWSWFMEASKMVSSVKSYWRLVVIWAFSHVFLSLVTIIILLTVMWVRVYCCPPHHCAGFLFFELHPLHRLLLWPPALPPQSTTMNFELSNLALSTPLQLIPITFISVKFI